MIVPMIKGECDGRFINWHFDPRILTSIGLGASGTTVQYGKDYPLIPALICESMLNGIVALDFTSILPNTNTNELTEYIESYANRLTEYIENCSANDLVKLYNHVFRTGSAVQKTQPTALPKYELNKPGPDHIQLAMNSFLTGHYTAEDGIFFYAVKEMETSIEIDFSSINTSWPFVNWYKKA